ncbi:WD40 repeat domain-containing protein [Nonomuraea jabiensis]|uniref:WD40 repeat protein n=1 Tax=Nonomuraea jabiensis TaxID=882448 RepID=A0A7W9GBK5_9ACTN|nr:WD40 repeat domain-containing protein [Nonomuraea jabiensis]MBB5780768.1 WD40 repeat protein [Nonomuraea jabiensis]
MSSTTREPGPDDLPDSTLDGADGREEGIRQEAHASGHARINQAGRDQHFYYSAGAHTRRSTRPGTEALECPYPGLAAFGPEQARWFFGRDGLVADLLARLDQRLRGVGGIQMVIAPSGTGKSSLLRAGLLPRLAQSALPDSHRWPVLLFTPTTDPVGALAAQICSLTGAEAAETADRFRADPCAGAAMLARHIDDDHAMRVVVVVDQFEELFTLCADDRQRRMFIDLLSRIADPYPEAEASTARPAGLVVIGMRADFYAACAGHPGLRTALEDAPLLVGAMSRAEVREAIIFPAQDVGLDIEPGLVELLLRDLGATSGPGEEETTGYEAGRLPLLAHALRVSWQQRNGATLTVEGYQATGGIQRALATTADRAFAGLDADGRKAARTVFLRLVKIGEGVDDGRRRRSWTELVEASGDSRAASAVVDVFTEARLLTREQDTVEITHEALLHGWPQLRRWIDGDRAGRILHQDLEEETAAWERAGGDPALLYRGSRLELAQAWAAAAPVGDLSLAARAFLSASARLHRRTVRLRVAVIAALAVLTVVAATTAVIGVRERNEALRQRDTATYNRILAEADRLADTDISLSAQLTLVAHRRNPGDDTYTRILNMQHIPLSIRLTVQADSVNSVAFSPSGRILAAAGSDGLIRLWDVADPAQPKPLGPLAGHTDGILEVAFSPDGQALASLGYDKSVRLWSVADPARPKPLGRPLALHSDELSTLAFSTDGHILVVADSQVHLWSVRDPARPKPLGRLPAHFTDGVFSLAFSPDGHMLAVGDSDQKVWRWSLNDPAHPRPLGRPLVHDGFLTSVNALAFSPGGELASASDDVRRWDVRTGELVSRPLGGSTDDVSDVAFSPDRYTLASTDDNVIRLWNVSERSEVKAIGQPLTGHTGAVRSLAFSADGRTLASGADDGTVRLWNLAVGRITNATGPAPSVAFGPDGRTLVGVDWATQLWRTTDRARPTPLGEFPSGFAAQFDGVLGPMALSPDWRTLATVGDRNHGGRSLRLWKVTAGDRAVQIGPPLTSHSDAFTSVAFSPYGRFLVAIGEDGSVRLWDVADPAHPAASAQPLTGPTGDVVSLAFSPDGHTLASADGNDVSIWNIADPVRPKPLSRLPSTSTDDVQSLAFSPDGHTLAVADTQVHLWSVRDLTQPKPLEQLPFQTTGSGLSLAFSPDGHTLASGGGDGSVWLWHISASGRAEPRGQRLTAHNGAVTSVAFSPDGHLLASAGGDRSIQLWELDVEATIRRICASSAGAMTADAWRRYVGDNSYSPPCGNRG